MEKKTIFLNFKAFFKNCVLYNKKKKFSKIITIKKIKYLKPTQVVFDLSAVLYVIYFENLYQFNTIFYFYKKNLTKKKLTLPSCNFRYKSLFYKQTYTEKFNSFFFINGKKLVTLKHIKLGFLKFFDELVYNFEVKFKSFKNITFFLNSISYDLNLFNFNNLLGWIVNFSKYIYFFKTKKAAKFIKKKIKKKYVIENFLIKKNFREKYTLKYFYFYIENKRWRSLWNRIFLNLEDLILNYKQSLFYENKNAAFRKVVYSFLKK